MIVLNFLLSLRASVGPVEWIALTGCLVGALLNWLKRYTWFKAVWVPYASAVLGLLGSGLDKLLDLVSTGAAPKSALTVVLQGLFAAGLATLLHKTVKPAIAAVTSGAQADAIMGQADALPGEPGGPVLKTSKVKSTTAMLALLSMFLALPITGCDFIKRALPIVLDILTDAADAENKTNLVEHLVTDALKANPDPVLESKIHTQIAKVRLGLDAAIALGKAGEGVAEKDPKAVWSGFNTAWADLETLIGPLGVIREPGKLAAADGRLRISRPLATRHAAPPAEPK